MRNLLIVDFRRVLKDKLLMIMGILSAGFSLLTCGIMAALFAVADGGDLEMMGAMGMGVDAASLFFSSFSLSSNIGLIAPVLLAIVLCKDFGNGTVRNKIIAGCSRSKMLLSNFIVCLTVLFGVVLLNAVLTLGISAIFMPFASVELTGEYIAYLLLSLLLELLIYAMASALITFLWASQKNAGLVIVLYVAVSMVLSLVASILSMVSGGLELVGGYDNALRIIEFFQNINVFNHSMEIGMDTSYAWKDLLRYIFTPTLLTALLLGLGNLKFRKKDLK